MAKPYNYVRFRWWEAVNLEKVSEELSPSFSVEMHIRPRRDYGLSSAEDESNELWVRADTLSAMLSRFRVLLNQKEAAPFTAKDIELRKKILELYPRDRPTPFPWSFSSEPKFETAK